MPVSSTWTNPSAAGTLDLATGAVLTETWVDAIASNFLYLGGVAGRITQIVISSSLTAASTTSGTAVVLPNTNCAITTLAGSSVLTLFGASFSSTVSGSLNSFGVMMDAGSLATTNRVTAPGSGSTFTVSGAWFNSPSAATHTYAISWATGSGTLSVDVSAYYYVIALELRR